LIRKLVDLQSFSIGKIVSNWSTSLGLSGFQNQAHFLKLVFYSQKFWSKISLFFQADMEEELEHYRQIEQISEAKNERAAADFIAKEKLWRSKVQLLENDVHHLNVDLNVAKQKVSILIYFYCLTVFWHKLT